MRAAVRNEEVKTRNPLGMAPSEPSSKWELCLQIYNQTTDARLKVNSWSNLI